ncbi:MAG: DUF1223 domain-containing protein [Betaproteobacteria bacterium]
MSVDVRWLVTVGALLSGAWFGQEPQGSAGRTPAPPAPVIAELFTSEGCSSCPPADDLLSDLVRRQPVPGVEVLALAEHVDYWDRLGWRDRFSSAALTARQTDYDAHVFHTNSIYTPQLVVDGQFQAVGSDRGAVRRALLRAARMPQATVRIGAAPLPDRLDARVDVRVDVPASLALRGGADVLVAIVEDNLTTDVRRGENSGRTLRHTAVVRSLSRIGAMAAGNRAWSTTASVPLGVDWKLESLRAIAFLQERDTRRVVGAAGSSLATKTGIR